MTVNDRVTIRITILAARHDIHTVRWCNALAERGYEISLLSMHAHGDPLDKRVHFYHLPFRTKAGYFLNIPYARSLVNKISPHLLHAHYASGYGTLGRFAGFHPFVLSVWGRDVYEVPFKSPIHRWLVSSNLQSADHVCSTSEVMADHTREVAQLQHAPAVTPFGIDLEQFQPAERKAREDDPLVIGTVKRLRPKYGVDLLIEAFRHLRQQMQSENSPLARRLRLRIVGDGRERGRLEQQVRDAGIKDVTTFTGWVSHEQVPAELNKLDVYVAVSRNDSESFGVAVLEASACQVPVVVSDVGGLPEVVEEGGTGFVVRREDPVATSRALRQLVTNPEMRKRMGRAGRRHVETRYAWEACVDRMEEVYDRVLNSS